MNTVHTMAILRKWYLLRGMVCVGRLIDGMVIGALLMRLALIFSLAQICSADLSPTQTSFKTDSPYSHRTKKSL